MRTIYRVIFTMAFFSRSDRDKFQAILNKRIPAVCAALGLSSAVTSGQSVTLADEPGYQWFDAATKNPVWGARTCAGFTDKTQRDTLLNALTTEFGTKALEYSYWMDGTGKCGAFNTDIIVEVDAADKIQVDVR